MRMHMHAHAHAHTQIHTCACARAHTCICTCTLACACMCVRTSKRAMEKAQDTCRRHNCCVQLAGCNDVPGANGTKPIGQDQLSNSVSTMNSAPGNPPAINDRPMTKLLDAQLDFIFRTVDQNGDGTLSVHHATVPCTRPRVAHLDFARQACEHVNLDRLQLAESGRDPRT